MKRMEMCEETDETVKERLLLLIEEGDATAILSPEYTESLNDLIKYEYVSIENEALALTAKGREAKTRGIKVLMEETVVADEEIKISDFPQHRVSQRVSNKSFLILLLFFLISLLAMISLINS